MSTYLGVKPPLDEAARRLARSPDREWARWVIYLLEYLDGAFRHQHNNWLQDIQSAIDARLRHGEW
mgnify:CR=1 FL=1